jgi:hypothetical protein
MDTARAATFATLQELPHLSKRFALKRFLGLTEEEIKENERMWREEQGNNLTAPMDAGGAMRSVGITPGGMGAEAAEGEATPDMAAEAEAAAAPAEGEAAPAAAPAA